MTAYTITQETVDLVKRFEGLELRAYRDPVGVVTIGYGYTNRAGFGPGVKMGDVWTEKQAEDMLRQALDLFAKRIIGGFTRRPEPHEFGAFLSLAYNIGADGFLKSTALKRWNAGDVDGAAEALQWWNKAGGKVLNGLTRRRAAEAEMLLNGWQKTGAARVAPDEPREKPAQSKTVKASAAQIATGAGGAVAAVGALDGTAQLVAIAGGVLVALLGLWIMRERLKKWGQGDR